MAAQTLKHLIEQERDAFLVEDRRVHFRQVSE